MQNAGAFGVPSDEWRRSEALRWKVLDPAGQPRGEGTDDEPKVGVYSDGVRLGRTDRQGRKSRLTSWTASAVASPPSPIARDGASMPATSKTAVSSRRSMPPCARA